MAEAYINRIATAVPAHDVHAAFIAHASATLTAAGRSPAVFQRMVDRCGIDSRFSCLSPGAPPAGTTGTGEFYRRGRFPGTDARMRLFRQEAPVLAEAAVERLLAPHERSGITHVVITCCTGFSAPGLDFEIITRCGLPRSIERTIVGFMGCYAAINALKLARHIVRSEAGARVLMLNVELCTLHLQDTDDIEQILSFLIFADGCSAALISAEPQGLAMERFRAVALPGTDEMITWNIGDTGFDMVLSGKVPSALRSALPQRMHELLEGARPETVRLWAVHPGGRSIIDAVEQSLGLPPPALAVSRGVLRCFGNMSSATVMFVLERMMARDVAGQTGCAMAFGPGVVAECMLFRGAGEPAAASAAKAAADPVM